MWLMTGMVVAGLLLGVGNSYAQENSSFQELEERVERLSQEVSALKQPAPPVMTESYARGGVTFGGYGELVYQALDKQTDGGNASGKKNTLDLYRFVLNVGYRFSEKWVMNSEIEFEHAAEDKRGEISVEMMALDYLWMSPLSLRTGLLLIPVGFLNEVHEPAVTHGVNRPNVERNIIPTTWRENGAGLFGQVGALSYRSYVVNGFQAIKDSAITTGVTDKVKGYTASSGVRDGRQKGSSALAEDMAWVGRLDYAVLPGMSLGGSFYEGDAGQGAMVSGQQLKARTRLWETHGALQWEGLELRGLYSRVSVSDTELINLAQSFTGTQSVGKRMWGGYGQLAYNVLSVYEGDTYLAPFVRYERYNTQFRVPSGYAADPANDRTEFIYGLTFRPISTIAVKGEYQNNRNRADSAVDQWNVGVGYMF